MKNNFIKTQDEKTYIYLLSEGFEFLGKDGDFYCFLNDTKKINFEDKICKKIIFTNIIAI